MRDLLLTAADVLEKAAAYIDEVETTKIATVVKGREDRVQGIANRYAELTGEDLPATELQKMSELDESALDLVAKTVEKTSAVVSMGRPAMDRGSSAAPQTKEERRKAAWENFGSFLEGNR